MDKTLDIKLARILKDRSCNDFILADAKDPDMAYGLAAPGMSPEQYGSETKYRTLDELRQQIREIIAQGLVDIMLMSASTNDILSIKEGLFVNSPMTPAIRANDTTDIWLAGRGAIYGTVPSRPFRTATIDHALCGKYECTEDERRSGRGADLGLYSVTFNNNPETDYESLIAYKQFRLEAEAKGFRHFLEVFSPNACGNNCPGDIGQFVSDHIVRALAGVTSSARPVFLKIPYYGPKAMEALARYDSSIVVGILGGSAGTTLDAFQMLHDAKKYGARVALYGRKINSAEHQLTFIKYLRGIADSQIDPVEAVKAYHGELEKMNIKPKRSLKDDLTQTVTSDSYNGTSKPATGKPASAVSPSGKSGGKTFDPLPDFSKMTPEEKMEWNLNRIRKSI
ncbi:MAG: hypothetical protein PHQ75_03400 [Thermoguttaceae bacterium]|nr:hypothetical protein [Thermoguttaceae bacterium]